MRFADPEKIIQQFGVVEDMKIADLGSGAGFFSIPLAKKVGEDGMVYAIDLREGVLSRLKRVAEEEYSLENIEVIKANIEKTKGTGLEDKICDGVVLVNTLFSISEKEKLAKEIKRILKERGKLLIVDWSESFGGIGPSEENLVLYDDAKKVFEEQGFSFVRDIKAGEHHYGIIFKV